MNFVGAELFIIGCIGLGYYWEEWLVSVVDLVVGVLKFIKSDC